MIIDWKSDIFETATYLIVKLASWCYLTQKYISFNSILRNQHLQGIFSYKQNVGFFYHSTIFEKQLEMKQNKRFFNESYPNRILFKVIWK